MIKIKKNGLFYYKFEILSPFKEIRDGIFTRLGGYSKGFYETLNTGIHISDNQEDVIKNRTKILNELGFSIENLIAMQQVHSDNISIITSQNNYGKESGIPETDAVITSEKGLILMAVVADCAVLSLYSPERNIIGIAHCGWRGTVKKLPESIIYIMKKEFKCNPFGIHAGISPSIGLCCYEIGNDVFSTFEKTFDSSKISFFEERNNRLYLNLKEIINIQLLNSGIKRENIEIINICTSCRKDIFYSHRAEKGNTGRFGVFIGLKK